MSYMVNNYFGNLKKKGVQRTHGAETIHIVPKTVKIALLSLFFTLPLFAQVPPATPKNLTATAGNQKVDLKWNKVADADLAKYYIYRGKSTWFINRIDSVVTDTFYVDNSVQNDTTYYYFVTAVDSSSLLSASSDTVEVTPNVDGVQIAELLKNYNDIWTGGTNGGVPLNTYYYDIRSQSLYLATDLDSAGIPSNAWISAVEIKPSERPGMSLTDFRVAADFVTTTSFSGFDNNVDVLYGPVLHDIADFPVDNWKRFNVSIGLWNGTDNLVVEFSHDNSSFAENGGVYLRETGQGNRTIHGQSDDANGPYPFTGIPEWYESRVAAMRLVYSIVNVLPPSNLTATSGHRQVSLSWTASTTSGVERYIIYRGTTIDNLTKVDSTSDGSTLTFTDTGLTNDVTYYYAVKAYKTNEYSPYSNQKSATPLYTGPVWWVTTTGSDANDGASDSPFANIATAISKAAAGDTVMVKDGTYTGSGNRNLNFSGKNLVLMSENGAANVTLDANTAGRHLLFQNAEDSTSQIIGFTLINGRPPLYDHGGSIMISGNAGPVFNNCIFSGNNITEPGLGGAVAINQGSPTFRNCTFLDNSTVRSAGAVYITGNTGSNNPGAIAPIFENCDFISNSATTPSGIWEEAFGGAVLIDYGLPSFADCNFDSNAVESPDNRASGGAVHIRPYYIPASGVISFKRSSFTNNSVTSYTDNSYGGGITIRSQAELINCVIADNEINPNSNWGYGGGLGIDGDQYYNGTTYVNPQIFIINTTIVNNSITTTGFNAYGGGIYLVDADVDLVIFNSIIYDNDAYYGPNIETNGVNPLDDYNNVEDLDQFSAWAGYNSVDYTPAFTDPANGDYSLSDASFCIGAGTASFDGIAAPTDDILGNTRPDPSGTNPDIGAYENSLAVSPYPGQVANLAGQAGHQQVILTWDPNQETDLNRYAVYQSTTPDFTPTANDSIGEVAAGIETFTAAGLTNRLKYYYRVTAIDNDGNVGEPAFEVAVVPRYTGPVWYVDDVATNGEGSPTSPFNQIQTAIDSAASGIDTVMVLPGTYTGAGNFEINLSNKDVIISSEKGADSTILSSDNYHRHFNINSGVSSNTKITGFTFKNGNPGNSGNNGGSIRIDGASPQFYNCVFTENEAEYGGAIALMWSGGLPGFYNCVFTGNLAKSDNGDSYGGAVYIVSFDNTNDPIQFNNCTFDGNYVEARYSAYGGALALHARAAFTNCLIVNNKATAGYPNYWGETAFGGGLYVQVDINGYGQVVSMVNTTVANDTAMYGGGGNSVGGGIFLSGWPDQKFDLFNSIVWGNYATQNGNENIDDSGNSTFRADYNIVEDGDQFSWFYSYGHNQTDDPQFVDAEIGDYQLADYSPGIGAGWTDFLTSTYIAPAADIGGKTRPDGAGAVYPDLGAYENSLDVSPYPRQVQNLKADGASYAIDLSWDENPDINGNIDYYIVYMSETDGFTVTAGDSVGKVDQGSQVNGIFAYTVTGLQNKTPYYFRVAAHNSADYTGVASEQISGQPGYSEPIWYVDDDAVPGGDGSPESPFQTIGDAWGVDANTPNPNFSGGDTIMVLPGTYQRFNDLDLLAPNVPFILMSQYGPDSTFIDGRYGGTTPQKSFIRFEQGADTTTQIIGFTITNCTTPSNGGAVRMSSGSDPKFMNCNFVNNAVETPSYYGGAVYIESSPYFVNCSFIDNSSTRGGAVYITFASSEPQFVNCTFNGNSATEFGGAVASQNAAELLFDHCVFEGNSSNNEGGAIAVDYANSITKWTTISNSLFVDNSNTNAPGAAIAFWGNYSNLIIEQTTITDNYSTGDAAALQVSNIYIFNSIIWDNSLENDGNPFANINNNFQITNSLIENGEMVPGFNINNSLDIDPLFTDTLNGDYTLSLASYAIGAGTPSYTHPRTGTQVNIAGLDLAGNNRIRPDGSNPDLGAYEHVEAETPYPDWPKKLVAEELHRAVRLGWEKVEATDVAYYIVYQSDETDSTALDSVAAVLPGTDTLSVTITNLINKTMYYFGVTAVDSSGKEGMLVDVIKATPYYQGPVWYVDIAYVDSLHLDLEGSINKPYDNIRQAIYNTSDGDTILLRPGIYSGDDNRSLNFQQVDEFGNMTTETRNLVIMGENGADSTIVNLNGAYFLQLNSGETLASKLIGITIKNGGEGAVNINFANLQINNCVFSENSNSFSGGAVSVNSNGSVKIRRTLFQNNSSPDFGNGGGALAIDNASAKVSNCIFFNNSSNGGGGAIFVDYNQSSLQVVHSLFLENESGNGPAAIGNNSNPAIGIVNSIFWDNMEAGSISRDLDYASSVESCILQNGDANPVWNLGFNYSFDPLIVEPNSGDFSLSEYSNAIGKGVESYYDFYSNQDRDVPGHDFLENTRPQPDSTLPDIGPIEHENAEPRRWVYFVAPDGKDENSGLSADSAFATIQRAIYETDDLDTVLVLSGTYTGTGNMELDFEGRDIVLRSADGPDATILDMENNGRAFDFYDYEPPTARIVGFTVINGSAGDGGAVSLVDASPRFYNMKFVNCSSSRSGGVISALDSDSRFINCVFTGNTGAGEASVAKISGGNITFKHCTIVNNHSTDDNSLVFDGGTHVIKNTVLWNNNVLGNGILNINDAATLDVIHSDIMGGFEGPGVLNHRPGFVDAGQNDFRLQDWSPLIGAADTTEFGKYDIDLNRRTVSDTTAPDIGAFESALARPDTTGYSARTWIVDENGDNKNNGSPGLPFGTIQRAVDYAIWNDVVSVQPGSYYQGFDTWGKDISIVGAGEPGEIEIIGQVFVWRDEAPLFTNLSLRNDGVALHVSGESEPDFTYIEFSGSTVGPVVEVIDASLLLDHVTFADNDGPAIFVDDTASVTVTNSIFLNTGDHFTVANAGTVSVTYSRTDSAGTGNISGDPRFVDVNDYRLMANSLCINAGDPGETDDDDTRTDMGAYPYLSDHDGPVWYVDGFGSDIDGDGSELYPFATVQAGINFALAGDTVFVSEGNFFGTAKFREQNIVLTGSGYASVLDGAGEGPVLHIGDGLTSGTEIRDLFVTGAPGGEAAISIGNSSPLLSHLWVTGNDNGISTDKGNPVIEYCLVTDNTGDGITISANTSGSVDIVNNTIANNGSSGLTNNSAATVNVRNSIVWGNVQSHDGTFNITYSDIAGSATGTGNIDSDPLFADAAAADYELQLLSPCIDKGDPNDPYDDDATIVDMGALPIFREFVGGNTAGSNIVVSADTTVIVNADLIVEEGDTLVIDPGATLYLGDGVSLEIKGILKANGNVYDPIVFTTLYQDDFFAGIILHGFSGGRVELPAYQYLTISNVADGSVPLVVTGSAILEHFTIAGNDTSINSLETDGTVTVNYSLFESSTGGTGSITALNSFIDDTAHFVNWSAGDYSLVETSPGIDIGMAEADVNVDPDFTYSDVGAHYLDQSGYPVDAIVVLYPAPGDTIDVSPDTSTLIGLDVFAQTLNEFGRFKTNASIDWDAGTVNGSFDNAITNTSDLDGEATNRLRTVSTVGALSRFVISADGVSTTSGVFRVVPGVPDSVALQAAVNVDTVMAQLDTIVFMVDVFDQFGNLVRDGEAVNWTVVSVAGNAAGFSFLLSTTTTINGVAMGQLVTDPAVALVGDQVRIQAESNGSTVLSKLIEIVPDEVFLLSLPDELTRNELEVNADLQRIDLTTTLIDTFGNPLEGVAINWKITTTSSPDGTLSSNMTVTDANGETGVTLTTGTISGYEYQVATWVTEPALVAALRNLGGAERSAAIPEAAVNLTFPVYSDLNDTTAVIRVVPGAPVAITADQTDTVYVVPGEIDSVVITAVDQYANLVSDGSVVTWAVTDNPDYTVLDRDGATTAGQAKLKLLAVESAGWLSRIDIDVKVESVFDAKFAEKRLTYIVEDVIAPAAVAALTITPAGWTSVNSFTLNWTNPVEHSGIAGAHYSINDNTDNYVEGQDITTLTNVALSENGAGSIGVWLQDNANNVDKANAVSITAKWDNVRPNNFTGNYPELNSWMKNNRQEIVWNPSSDITAGLKEYRLVLDGNDIILAPDVTEYVYPSTPSEGSHTYTVFAVDSALNETELDGGVVTFNVDFTPPNITHNQQMEGTVNTAVTIAATFSDPAPASGVVRSELFYRKGGEAYWQNPVNLASGAYSIASTFVTSAGVEYYIEAEDFSGNIIRKPAEGFYSISVSITAPGLSSTRNWPTGIPSGTTVADYQFISFPAQPANNTPTDVLVDDLGDYDNTKWRFYSYATGTWIEFANIAKIEAGKGYFLIVKDAGMSINTGQASSVKTHESFTINLPAGEWVMIGNPYDFEIPLDNVFDQDSVIMAGNSNFYAWDGEWIAADALKPWHGYIFKSANGGQLFINPRKQNGAQARIAYDKEIRLGENEWVIDIDVLNGFGADQSNRVGVLAGASDGYDDWDAFEPPLIPGGVSLRIDNTQWEEAGDLYTMDIKSISEEGHFWDMNVVAQDAGRNVVISFDGFVDVPEEFDVFLIDKTIGIAQNLKGRDRYVYPAGTISKQRDFRLVVGTRKFVEEHNAGVSLYPEDYTLGQNFPNPFNPKTTILISVEDEAVVDLVVYNLLGETVTTLARDEYLQPGYYNYIWAGYNDLGKRVASGLYLYSTVIKSPSGKVLLNQTRKMIFVK